MAQQHALRFYLASHKNTSSNTCTHCNTILPYMQELDNKSTVPSSNTGRPSSREQQPRRPQQQQGYKPVFKSTKFKPPAMVVRRDEEEKSGVLRSQTVSRGTLHQNQVFGKFDIFVIVTLNVCNCHSNLSHNTHTAHPFRLSQKHQFLPYHLDNPGAKQSTKAPNPLSLPP